MGLAVTSILDPSVLFTGGNYDPQGGCILGGPGTVFYYDRLDFFAADWLPGTGAGEWVRFDPLLVSNLGVFDDTAAPGTISGVNSNRIAVGEWNRGANTQKIYQYRVLGSGNSAFNEVQPLALNQVITLDPWPLLGNEQTRSSLISTDPGFYTNGGPSSWVVFETWGFALNPAVTLRHTDNITYNEVPVLVDLATGHAALVVDGLGNPLITAYGTESHKFSNPQLFSQAVQFTHVQFAPDDISTGAAPRGVLYLLHAGSNNPADATRSRFWIKAVDWNPLNAVGTPSRTHLRQRLLSAVDFLKATPATFDGIHETGSPISKTLVVHPRTNRIIFPSSSSGPSGGQLDAGESKFLIVSPTPAVSTLTDPSELEEVKTGKTVAFFVEALGTLVEKIAGVSVAWQLRRVSSVDEVLLTTPTPGETVTVANAPMSPTDPNVSPVIVKENGTPLTLTTHYTVNRATGQITFVAPKPLGGGAIYTATYRHYTVPATPPHGILLNTASTTDSTGAAVVRIKYAEETTVPDRWDRLDAS